VRHNLEEKDMDTRTAQDTIRDRKNCPNQSINQSVFTATHLYTSIHKIHLNKSIDKKE